MKLPEIFLLRLREIYKDPLYEKILRTFEIKRKTTFRINHIKITSSELDKELKSYGFKVRRVTWYQDAFILLNHGLKELAQTPLYQEGKIYVQNLSSMIPPLLLELKPTDKVLDLAAAPGSKTTQMASILKNQAMIIAVEKNKPRYYKLLANLQLQGVENTQAILYDGIKIWRNYYEFFDKVLLDAPCSSEARFSLFEPKSFGYWRIKKIKESSKKQKGLILSGLRTLKPGGILVYSTCTFAPEENEGVIDWLLRRVGDKVKIEEINLKIKNTIPGITSWRKREYNPEVKKCIRIIPDKIMEGFFITKIRKMESMPEDGS